MRQVFAIFIVVLISAVLLSCAPEKITTPENKDSAAPVGGKAGPDVTDAATDIVPQAENAAVVKLLARNGQVKSYSFSVANLPDMRGGRIYHVKGTKIHVEPMIEEVTKLNLDAVYLDTEAKTAAGYCARGMRNCVEPNTPIPLSYDDWIVPLPPSYISDIKYGEIIGSLTFLDKPVTRVKYQKDGRYYEAYLDNYFGYPQRVAIATDAEMSKIVGGYEYRDMGFNSVKDDQVVHVTVTT